MYFSCIRNGVCRGLIWQTSLQQYRKCLFSDMCSAKSCGCFLAKLLGSPRERSKSAPLNMFTFLKNIAQTRPLQVAIQKVYKMYSYVLFAYDITDALEHISNDWCLCCVPHGHIQNHLPEAPREHFSNLFFLSGPCLPESWTFDVEFGFTTNCWPGTGR